MPLSEQELKKRDAKRNIGEELLEAIRDVKAGRYGAVHEITPAAQARAKTGLSQAQFAALLGVPKRTLQDWEQGRRQPSGAAKTLIAVALKRPKVLREVAE